MLLCVISMFIYACECIGLQHCDYDVHVLNYALSNKWFDLIDLCILYFYFEFIYIYIYIYI